MTPKRGVGYPSRRDDGLGGHERRAKGKFSCVNNVTAERGTRLVGCRQGQKRLS